ncbi:MAG: hypothetical protein IJQ20_10215 [Paludibacteraceae bacterium]|nr:hypothetical protein [Paludibacteraceae bacterium]
MITDKQKIFNATGYYADGRYYHYVKNHLGSICLVIDSETDSVIQNTSYSASGVPSSTNLDVQPYLYNGKEFIEAYGLNTYDYGFRGYYAPIGRFTSIDPLTEQTPWQSPYSYGGNNFINNIDWMGLSIKNIYDCYQSELDRTINSLNGNHILHYTELNNDGTVKEHINNGDNSVVYDGEK